jgi:uncharacterized protein YdiU (UPF0061 family)
MQVGFIHGVMNTDNMTISGETIDYGPCAFMDAFDPATVFSSIDHGGRYAYGNQPNIAQWNLARLGEALLPLLADDTDAAIAAATEVLQSFRDRFTAHWTVGGRAKLGLASEHDGDEALIGALLELLGAQRVDMTCLFRALSGVVRGDAQPARARFAQPEAFDAWAAQWLDRLAADGRPVPEVAASMDAVNPVYVPRNHLVEAALEAATAGDLGPVTELVDVLRQPFTERPGLEAYAEPAPPTFGKYVTFCGT